MRGCGIGREWRRGKSIVFTFNGSLFRYLLLWLFVLSSLHGVLLTNWLHQIQWTEWDVIIVLTNNEVIHNFIINSHCSLFFERCVHYINFFCCYCLLQIEEVIYQRKSTMTSKKKIQMKQISISHRRKEKRKEKKINKKENEVIRICHWALNPAFIESSTHSHYKGRQQKRWKKQLNNWQ